MHLKRTPLISCLCVTEKRVQKLERAIKCFFNQTYSNKELVVVYKDSDVETRTFLKRFSKRVNCVAIDGSKPLTLGEKRNISILHSRGDVVCNWDDDDWYHPERLECQFNAIASNDTAVSILAYYLIFDEKYDQAYLSFFRLWESTIMFRKDAIKRIKYPALNMGEDQVLVTKLLMNTSLFPVIAPNLYIYVCHGSNTCSRGHFKKNIFADSKKLSKRASLGIKKILNSNYSATEIKYLVQASGMLKEFDYFYSYKKTFKPLK